MAREIFHNASARPAASGVPGPADEPDARPFLFHRRLPNYRPSALVDVPSVAEVLGVGRIWVKDESSRFGLAAFKVLGGSWAAYRAVEQTFAERFGAVLPDWEDVRELRAAVARLQPMTLVTATAGNHGRAVARVARWLGFGARIFVPASTGSARISALREEGAEVLVVDGTYDEAVERSAAASGETALLVSDMSWVGYERIPRWVIEGYSTLFREVDDAIEGWPDVVVVPLGVGALAAAAVRHYRRPGVGRSPVLVGVEPVSAAGVLASLRAGHIVTVPGPHDSMMAGLDAGTPSMVAWPYLAEGLDAVVAIDDDRASEAMRALARVGVVAGETGAATLGGLTELIKGGDGGFPVDPAARVLLLCTEGATDPENYERIVGHRPP